MLATTVRTRVGVALISNLQATAVPSIFNDGFAPHVGRRDQFRLVLKSDGNGTGGRNCTGTDAYASRAAYRSVQANPAHSITYAQLAAALAKLGRLEEARAAAARVLEVHPTFSYSRQFAGVNCAPALAGCLGDALRTAGLPE